MFNNMYVSELMSLSEERLSLIPRAKPGDSSFNWKDEIYEAVCAQIRWIAGNHPSEEEAIQAGMSHTLTPYPDCAGWRRQFEGEIRIIKNERIWYGKANPLLPRHGRLVIDWRVD